MATNKPIKTTNQTVGGTYNNGGVTLADGDQISHQLDASGNLLIAGTISFTDPAAGPTGSPVPTDAIYDGINVGGTLRGWTGVNPSGVVFAGQIDLTSVNGVTALTGTGGQGAGSPRVTVAVDSATVAGSASLPAGTNVIGVTGVAQASTTSGQSGELIQGAVTTAAPSYSNNTTNPISLDLAGNVRVNVAAGSVTVTEADMLNITGSATSAAVLSGFPKTDCTGYYTVSVQWTTITSGNTAVAEWSNDGSTWTTAVDQLAGAASFTAAGVALYNVYGKQFRLRCSVFASGSVAANTQFRGEPIVQEVLVSNFPTIVATGHGTAAAAIRVELPTDGTGVVGANQGTPATIANAWPAYLTDNASHALTVNSTTTTSKFALDQNIISILGTAPTTAGFIDIKGADGNVFVRQATAANLNAQVVGAAAQAASVSGNPLLSGGRAATAYPTAVADGQASAIMLDKAGRTVAVLNAPRDLIGTFSVSATDNSSHTLIAAGASGVFNDIIDMVIVNTSATGTEVDISDGTTTYPFYAPPTDMRGIAIQSILPATSTATAWTFQATTGVTTLKIWGIYAKNK